MIEAGARVALLMDTTRLHIDMHTAAAEHGFTLVPMPMRDTPADMALHLERARADVVLADAGHRELAGRIAGSRPVVVATGAPPAATAATSDAPYAVLRTSGTTGPPRLVDIPRKALAVHAAAARRRLEADGDSTWLAALPLWHIGGVAMVHRSLHGGGRVVASPRSDAAGLAAGMRRHDVTHVSLVPTMLRRLLEAGVRPHESLACVLVGGDRLDPALVRRALEQGWPVYATYGLTEACSQVATATPEELHADPTSCGRPLDGVRVSIRPTEDAEEEAAEERSRGEAGAGPEGEVGLIVVDGPTLALPGPLETGDLGRLVDGRLHVVGRLDDRITTGGEKVDPVRVEAVLEEHPDVAQAGVAGLPDPAWGQRVVAAVVPRPGRRPDPGALRNHARQRLAGHEVPKDVVVVESLPRTTGGKLRRRALLELWPRRSP